MKNRLFDFFMPLLPKNDLSHWVGRLAHRQLPAPLAKKSVKWFANRYKINMSEAEYPIEHYQTIGELFTRRLKTDVRPLGSGDVVHPADALISQAGRIEKLQMIQAKGKLYTVQELLRSGHYHQNFEGGSYLTYYLCPTDYHRVHSPVDGEIVWSCHIPGEMWPVNEWSVNKIPNLFAINERVVVIIQTARGLVALVMVAATNVGNMTMTFDPKICSKYRPAERQVFERSYSPPISIQRGTEIGVFNMGSTVIMLYEKDILGSFDVTALRGTRAFVAESLIKP
jgi:phosphatidylserine decarboxylase